MKSPGKSRDSYETSASGGARSEALSVALEAVLMPAHSGPELATSLPNAASAQDLARTLLTDSIELQRIDSYASSTYSLYGGGFSIGLARR